MIAENSSAALVFDDAKTGMEILAALRASPDVTRAAIYRSGGELFAVYHRNDGDGQLPPIFDGISSTHRMDGDAVTLDHPILQGKSSLGTIVIQASLEKFYRTILWYGFITFVLVALALYFASLLIGRLNRTITDPLSYLSRLMQEVSQRKDYSLRSPCTTSDEVGTLARMFNDMLEQIQTRDTDLEQEIAVRKQAEDQLDQLAHFDTVTKLPNRYFFNDRLHAMIGQSACSQNHAAVMFLDVDNFKVINDTLGHHVGDKVLQLVAQRLSETLRVGDTISRVGGDEFAIIAYGLEGSEQASVVARKCIDSLATPIVIEGHEIYATVSIGISIYPDDAADAHEILKNADTAMYYAKNKGKNTYQTFFPEMKDSALKRLTLESGLRRALDREEFELVYQPQIELKTGRVVGVEALLRWRRPALGYLSPMEFIPVAEETGLIVPIGLWVLRKACRQMKALHALGFADLRVAVNVSGRQFKEEDLVPAMLRVTSETGLEPRFVDLELTESTLMDSAEVTLAKLRQLHTAGFSLSIDDFGTGYSSMSYLKRFPIDTLKVDKGFVMDIPTDKDDAAIVAAIIAMSTSLGRGTVAEGVETEEQLNFLRDLGCTHVQGYYFARPLPPVELEAYLRKASDSGNQVTRKHLGNLIGAAGGPV